MEASVLLNTLHYIAKGLTTDQRAALVSFANIPEANRHVLDCSMNAKELVFDSVYWTRIREASLRVRSVW